MALKDRLENTPRRVIHGKPCSIGHLLETLDPDEAAALNDMLHTLGWPAEQIYQALIAEGHQPGRQTINRHRSRACRCFQ